MGASVHLRTELFCLLLYIYNNMYILCVSMAMYFIAHTHVHPQLNVLLEGKWEGCVSAITS